MAKKKDLGDYIRIRFVKERDTLSKFKKILRHFFQEEKKDITVDMVTAPEIPKDFLNSLVFGAKALKTQGHTITLMVTPENYLALKDVPDVQHFQLEIAQVISDEEISEMMASSEGVSNPFFSLKENILTVEKEGIEELPDQLPGFADQVLENYSEVILDLTKIPSLPSSLIQMLILESLNMGNSLKIRVLPPVKESLENNPQAGILNIEVDEYSKPNIPVMNEIEEEEEEEEQQQQQEASPSVLEALESSSITGEESAIPKDYSFVLRLNCLTVGKMDLDQFFREFPTHFEELLLCGDEIYIDLCYYQNLEDELIDFLLARYVEARVYKKDLIFRMLASQKNKMLKSFPIVQEVEPQIDLTPTFEIQGGFMEVRNVTTDLFLSSFPDHFKKLIATGHKNLIVDISTLSNVSERAIELLVLCYMEGVGRGVKTTYKIRPEMEDAFLKSGRGRSLQLEIIKPEYRGDSPFQRKNKGDSVDMDKIFAGMNDKLSTKILKKQYDTVHIESRGSFQNWSPTPKSSLDVSAHYSGPERRQHKRYPAQEVEVSIGKGTLGKIADRRYALHNLSQTGTSFNTNLQFSRAETIRIKLYAPEKVAIEITAKVIWCSPVPSQAMFSIGVQFFNVSAIAKAQLQEILKELYRKTV